MESMLNRQTSLQQAGPKNKPTDQGAALVMAAIISVVVMALGAVTLSFANRESAASNNDRQRQHAIDAAMAASVVANSALATNSAYAGSGLVTFAGGAAQFEVAVTTDNTVAGGFRKILTSSGYAPSKALATSVRTVRQVVELDPVSFGYGVFAAGNFDDGSSSTVLGGMYTGGNITLGNAHDFIGDLYARGDISSGSNQQITGTLHANGNVSISTGIDGSVYAGGNIAVGGTIRDNAQAGGTVNCAKVSGSCTANSPPPPVPVQQLPTFVWNPANYLPVVASSVTGAQLLTVASDPLQGVYYVSGNVDFRKQDSLRLTGPLTIVASGNISLPGSVENNAPGGVNVQLTVVAMGNATAANNITIPSTVPTLLYTKGNFDEKNSSVFTGVLYVGGNISIGAHSAINFAPVSAPGFDWAHANPQNFTIRNISTRETTGS